jgi:hypothetical protein
MIASGNHSLLLGDETEMPVCMDARDNKVHPVEISSRFQVMMIISVEKNR